MPIRKSLNIPDEIYELIKKSGLLNEFSFNQLIMICITNYMPILLNKKNFRKDFINYAQVMRRRRNRKMLVKLRTEAKSKYYFFTRFLSEFRKMLNRSFTDNKLKKEWLINIMDLYIKESKTYKDNEKITNYLIKFRNSIKRSKRDINEIKEILDIKIQRVDNKQREKVYKEK